MYDQDASHMLDNVRKWKTVGGQQFDQYFQFGKVVCQNSDYKDKCYLKVLSFFVSVLIAKSNTSDHVCQKCPSFAGKVLKTNRTRVSTRGLYTLLPN